MNTFIRHIIMTIGIFIVALGIFMSAIGSFQTQADEQSISTLEDAIKRATIECYATEGRYPPDVSYIEKNYGVKIDRNTYNVFYDGFASNIMPSITVVANAKPKTFSLWYRIKKTIEGFFSGQSK